MRPTVGTSLCTAPEAAQGLEGSQGRARAPERSPGRREGAVCSQGAEPLSPGSGIMPRARAADLPGDEGQKEEWTGRK